jgi:hypothetical protein
MGGCNEYDRHHRGRRDHVLAIRQRRRIPDLVAQQQVGGAMSCDWWQLGLAAIGGWLVGNVPIITGTLFLVWVVGGPRQ